MKPVIYVFLALLSFLPLGAQDMFKILYGPYLQSVSGTEATVVWVTNREAVSWVEIAPDDGSHFYAEARPQYFQADLGKKAIGTLHAVRIPGLREATTYRYRIYSKEVTEKSTHNVTYGRTAASNVYSRTPYTFTTLDAAKPEIRFAMVNDIHEKEDLLEALMKNVPSRELDFVLFNGDMLSEMVSEEQLFGRFMQKSVELFATDLPVYFARGNHETRGLFSSEYLRYFPTPTGRPYYSFRQGPVFFLVLDGAEDKPDNDIENLGLADFDTYRRNEATWLKGVLNSDAFRSAPVRIAVIHIPPAGSGWHGSLEVRKHLVPLLNEAGIHLMLCGDLHRHLYLPSGDGDCRFPILVNSNEHIVDSKVTAGRITLTIKDREGRLFKEINIP